MCVCSPEMMFDDDLLILYVAVVLSYSPANYIYHDMTFVKVATAVNCINRKSYGFDLFN